MYLSKYFGGEPLVTSMTLGFSIAMLIVCCIIMAAAKLDDCIKIY